MAQILRVHAQPSNFIQHGVKMTVFITPRFTDGLGNRLFQYATSLGLARHWDIPLLFNKVFCEPSDHGDPAAIFRLFPSIPFVENFDSKKYELLSHEEKDLYTYCEVPDSPTTPMLLAGHWQSPRYFESVKIEPDWKNVLGDHAEEIAYVAALETSQKQSRTWMIHFRHGDYDTLNHHQLNLMKYYQKCIYMIPAGSRLHVFSDEPDKCAETVEYMTEGRGIQITWSKEKEDVNALYEMSLCTAGAISANSTFSWWGAYFAKERAGKGFKAYYPDSWGSTLPPTTDLVPVWGERVSLH